jgi:hypothetical protein
MEFSGRDGRKRKSKVTTGTVSKVICYRDTMWIPPVVSLYGNIDALSACSEGVISSGGPRRAEATY